MGFRRSGASDARGNGGTGAWGGFPLVAGLLAAAAICGPAAGSAAWAAELQPTTATSAPTPPAASSAPDLAKAERLPSAAMLPSAVLRAASDPEPDPSAVDKAVMVRMLASEDVAVPIMDLGDALATSGSTAPKIGEAPPEDRPQLPPMAMALLPERAAVAPPTLEGLSPLARPASDDASSAAGADQATLEDGAISRLGRIVSSVNLRTKPDGSAGTLAVLASNTPVTVIGCDYWCEVEADGKRGFVFKRFVKLR